MRVHRHSMATWKEWDKSKILKRRMGRGHKWIDRKAFWGTEVWQLSKQRWSCWREVHEEAFVRGRLMNPDLGEMPRRVPQPCYDVSQCFYHKWAEISSFDSLALIRTDTQKESGLNNESNERYAICSLFRMLSSIHKKKSKFNLTMKVPVCFI